MTRFVLSLTFIVLAFAVDAAAQGVASRTASGSSRSPASIPFGAGETLVFEGKISKFISITIGDLRFEVANGSDADKLNLKIDATSRGTMLKLFRYSFEQKIDTVVDSRGLHAYSSIKHDVQKSKIRDSVTTLDYDRRMVTWVETNGNEPTQPPRTIASDVSGPTHDIVSAIYLLRTLPLSIGYKTSVDVTDSGLVYKIPVVVAAREKQKSIFGEVWCYRVEPELFGPNRFFEQKGKMEIWITDDARRIPVRARVNAEVGKVDIRLKQALNLK